MLEMLNPTGADMLRFAGQVIHVRRQIHRALKTDRARAQALAVELFCSPPESARRTPDAARLKADSMRFFGWSSAQWQAHEASLDALLHRAQHATVMHDGLKVHCYQWQPPAGPTAGRILLCHGWEGYALNFALLIQRALEAGLEVHAFDHLAHGRSEGRVSGLPMALATLLSVAAHIQRTSGPIDLLVGHSLGGAAVSWAAANGAIRTPRVALIAPFYDTDKLSRQWSAAHLLSEEVRALLRAGLESSSGKRFDEFMPAALAQNYAKTATAGLIVHDRGDKITAFRHSAALAEQAPHFRLHATSQLGHIGVLADAPSMDQVVRFASRSLGRGRERWVG